MRLKYVGPLTEGVHIAELELDVAHGEIIDAPDDVGQRLAESADWQVTSRKKGGDD